MQKKNFISLILGVVGGLLFAVGMCMCLLPEWNAFTTGVVVAAIGAAVLLVLLIVRWKMEGWHLHVNLKAVGKIAFGVLGALVLGVGMCMIMVWNIMIPGLIVGVVGIACVLLAYPLYQLITRRQRKKIAPEILRLTDELTKGSGR